MTLRADAAGIDLMIGVPGRLPVQVLVDSAGGLSLPAALSPRDGLLVARLLTCLPEAYSRSLEAAVASAAPDTGALAAWRRDLSRLARAADRMLAAALSDGADPFVADPAMPFVWPTGG
jgi:hypothetical protein